MEVFVCKTCGIEKPITEYYVYKFRATECKDCARSRVAKRESRLRSEDPNWVVSERERCRLRYKRLDYCTKQKEWDKDKYWKRTVEYKNLAHNLRKRNLLPSGHVAHHWCYHYLTDVFIMPLSLHKKIHKFLVLNMDSLCFQTIDDILLDSKDKHLKYLTKLYELKLIPDNVDERNMVII